MKNAHGHSVRLAHLVADRQLLRSHGELRGSGFGLGLGSSSWSWRVGSWERRRRRTPHAAARRRTPPHAAARRSNSDQLQLLFYSDCGSIFCSIKTRLLRPAPAVASQKQKKELIPMPVPMMTILPGGPPVETALLRAARSPHSACARVRTPACCADVDVDAGAGVGVGASSQGSCGAAPWS